MRRVDNAKQSAGTGTFNNYQFDFGLGSGPKGSSNAPLKDQKLSGSGYGAPWTSQKVPHMSTGSQPASGHQIGSGWSSHSKLSGSLGGASTAPSQSWGSSTTSTQTGWAGYQPMTPGLGGTKPAVGGSRSMNSAPINPSLRSDVSKLSVAGIAGVAQNQSKGDDVFGDLLGAAMNRSNVPLNKINPTKTSFSMGNLDSSLPKAEEPAKDRTPMAKMPRSSSTTDPVSRRPVSNSAEKDPVPPVPGSSSGSFQDDVFNFPRNSSTASGAGTVDPFSMSDSSSSIGRGGDPFDFGASSMNGPPQRTAPTRTSVMTDPFDVFKSSSSTPQKPVDSLDSFLTKSVPPSKSSPPAPAMQDDGWGIFGAGGSGSLSSGYEPTTTELEGLPPPPSGVTAKAANDKGSEFYKNGQFPDAIKWLSWSVELLKNSPNNTLLVEVLTCRMSCFKEIGEMRKAVADCTKSIELQPANASLLMLRANLYESMEKYKLAVADLKLVMTIDSNNRQARAILSRLQRMIAQ